MNTREQILLSSLELFAEKGYDGVSVREIGRAVGVRESALYKHFKNKEDILNKIVEEMQTRISEAYSLNKVPKATSENVVKGYQSFSVDDLCEISWNLFQMYTKDSIVSNFRKLLMREQYTNPAIAQQYNEIFLNGVIKSQAQTFAALIQGGFFREENPEIIALHFYAPIFLLFQRYDSEPDKEHEIKEMLYQHVRVFGANYRKESV